MHPKSSVVAMLSDLLAKYGQTSRVDDLLHGAVGSQPNTEVTSSVSMYSVTSTIFPPRKRMTQQ